MSTKICAVLSILALLCSLSFSQEKPLKNSSTMCGPFIWGGSNSTVNTEHRFAESAVYTRWTKSLYHPTHLNLLFASGRPNTKAAVEIYISRTPQISINMVTDPHNHQGWWNGSSANKSQLVLSLTMTGDQPVLVSGNIENWIMNNPADVYFIMFDQLDYSSDAQIVQAWLGPEGTVTTVASDQIDHPQNIPMSNYPNPFNSSTTLQYSVSQDEFIIIKVYNENGQIVKTIEDGAFQSSGDYEVTWDGNDDDGKQVSTGVYFIILETPNQKMQKKVALLR